MFCSEWALVKITFDHAIVEPLRCKCWTCEECRPGRTRRLVEEAKRGKPDLFVTLTSRRRPDLTAAQAAVNLVEAWRKVRREFVRVHGKGSLPFLAVFERTKKGWPHLHIVCRCKWLPHRWLSQRMKKLIDSPHVWVRRVYGVGKVADYCTKYISKDPHRFAGTKRYWRSLDYLFPVAEDDPDPWNDVPWWQVVQRFWLFAAQDLQQQGFKVTAPWARAPPRFQPLP